MLELSGRNFQNPLSGIEQLILYPEKVEGRNKLFFPSKKRE